MRISDWSSDVCSSDLDPPIGAGARDPLQIDALGFGDARGKRADLDPVGQARARQHRLRPGSWSWSGGPCHHCGGGGARRDRLRLGLWPDERSEEHTSQLQSLMRNPYAVFWLIKKTTPPTTYHKTHTTS